MIRDLVAEYRKYKSFKLFVEESTWDQILLDSSGKLEKFMFGVVLVVVLYFGSVVIATFMKHH